MTEEILKAVLTVISIFLMIGAGLLIAWRKWITPEGAKALPKIIINIAVPSMAIYYFYTDIPKELFFASWLPLIVCYIVLFISYYIGKLCAVLFRVPKGKRGIFNVLFTLSNSMFIGFPVAHALFGDTGVPFAIIYYFANTTFFWTAGYLAIRKDADIIAGTKSRITLTEILKKFAVPPIITIAIMCVVIVTGIKLPDIITTTSKYLSDLTTPLSLIFMGCEIFWAGRKGAVYERNLTPVLLGRFIITPALSFAACMVAINLFSSAFPAINMTLMRNVFTVQTGLPVITSCAILADYYGADSQYATRSFFWTTLISIITIPAYMILFQLV